MRASFILQKLAKLEEFTRYPKTRALEQSENVYLCPNTGRFIDARSPNSSRLQQSRKSLPREHEGDPRRSIEVAESASALEQNRDAGTHVQLFRGILMVFVGHE